MRLRIMDVVLCVVITVSWYRPFEVELDIFAKSAAVVIADGLRISEWLQERIRLKDPFCDDVASRFVDCSQILHQ